TRCLTRENARSSEEVAALWPDHEASSASSGLAAIPIRSRDGRPAYEDGAGSSARDNGDRDILVLEYQWRDVEIAYLVTRPDTGEQRAIDAETWERERQHIAKNGLAFEMRRRTTIRRAFLLGNDVVQQDAPSPQHFTYAAI